MVHWSSILSSKNNRKTVVSFVEGQLNLRDVRKNVDSTEARKEFSKITSTGVDNCRRLARKALRRRSISYTLND